ncbi:RNA_recognition motif-containing protein [Hexamita inflata]|uniref:RNA recognition motif-containing protein n=1 Tax=Hexamita inflata TaxID=28002 RepID=A0AA86NWG7_9EUKA|nr:RNA recognition motif-containing protein [Hexamita inflata]CAI9962622.1 RNA recognition motif-containing protein [Hexamita inflata]
MSFDLRKEFQQKNSRNQNRNQNYDNDEEEPQKEFVSKHTYKIQENSSTIVVSFVYKTQPDLNEGKIVHILKTVIKQNPLSQPPRVYGHKFYLTFTNRPDGEEINEILQLTKQAYRDCKVFVKRDEVTQREKSTVYLGKLLGVDKEQIEELLKHLNLNYKEVRVAYDKQTQRPKNFGYIEFRTEEEARNAVSQLAGQKLGLSDGLKAVMMVDK